MNKRLICALWVATLPFSLFAQSGTNSPYSQYGIGMLSDQSQGYSRAMNGVGLGLRKGNIVNTLNPASYSAIDSLTMLFDVAVSAQVTNFKEGNARINARNSDFEYAVGSFRLLPNIGMAFGILPLSNVGYQYSANTFLNSTNGSVTETYSGQGGLHQVFLGAGWRVMKPLSIGVNLSYLWGTTERSITTSGSSSINSLTRMYSVSVSSYKLDWGLQWMHKLNKEEELIVGATVGIGHKLNGTPELINANASVSDTLQASPLHLPMSYGIGATWIKNNSLTVAADLKMTNWSSISTPCYVSNSNGSTIQETTTYKNLYQALVGVDYVPDELSPKYLKRVHYKMGAGYSTPYYNINGKNGPKEFSLSAGFSLPLQNSYNNRSILNISAQWVHFSATDLITENTFRLNLGLTFNERWFAKWKID